MKRYSKYFYKENGQWKMTYKGWKEYNRKVKGTSGKPMVTPEGVTVLTSVQTTYSDSPFKKFMDSMGVRGISSKSFGSWQRETAGAVWGRYAEKSPAAGMLILQQGELQGMMLQELLNMIILLQVPNRVI